MPWIFRYFWFVAAAFMLVNLFIWKRRLASVVERGIATQLEVDQFMRWTTVALIGYPIVAGSIGLIAGWSWPLCSGVMLFTDVPRALVSTITLSAWAAMLWWVWRRNGDEFIARVFPALDPRSAPNQRYSPRVVRWVVTVALVLNGIGLVTMSQSKMFPLEQICPANAVR
jgi:hypothetical protein